MSAEAYYLGLDLAQRQDWTALAVLRRPAPPEQRCELCYLTRYPRGTPYTSDDPADPGIVQHLAGFLAAPPLPGCVMAVDQTGVGRAVVEGLLTANLPATIIPVSITAGSVASQNERGDWNVPKRDLVAVIQMLLGQDRLWIDPTLQGHAREPYADVLKREFDAFQVKITPAGNETFASWRERDHDDCVLAVALAAWAAERFPTLTRESIGHGPRRAAAMPPRGEYIERDYHRGGQY